MAVPANPPSLWHPRFHLDEVLDIQPVLLPQRRATEQHTASQEVLVRGPNLMSLRRVKALTQLSPRLVQPPAAPGPPSQYCLPPCPLSLPAPCSGCPRTYLSNLGQKQLAQVT